LTLFQPPARMMVDVLCPLLRSSCAAPTLREWLEYEPTSPTPAALRDFRITRFTVVYEIDLGMLIFL
jgi:hypothetical protein